MFGHGLAQGFHLGGIEDPFEAGDKPGIAQRTAAAEVAFVERVEDAVELLAGCVLRGLVFVFGNLAAGEGVAGKKYTGGRAGFRSGPVDVTVAYSQTEVTTDDVKLTVVGGAYDFGVVKLMGSYQQAEYQSSKEKHPTVGLTAPVGVGQIRASYVMTDGSGAIGERDAEEQRGTQRGDGGDAGGVAVNRFHMNHVGIPRCDCQG